MKKFIILVTIILLSLSGAQFVLANTFEDTQMYMNEVMKKITLEYGTYADFYAGIYADENDHHIIFRYVKNKLNDDDRLLLSNLVDNEVEIIESEYTYNYLLDKSASITHENRNNENYVGNYIDTKNNRIVIEMYKDASTTMYISNKTESVTLSDYNDGDATTVVYTQKNTDFKGKVTKRPGSPTLNSCSVGFRAKYKGKYGFVTAGHCAGSHRTPDGKVLLKKEGGNSDYAFIEAEQYAYTNKFLKTYRGVKKLGLQNYTPFVSVGDEVGKAGAETGFTSGKVYTTDYSWYDAEHKIEYYRLSCAYVLSKGGDSGGPIFAFDGENGILYGILKGGKVDGTSTCFTNIMFVDGDLIRGRY